MIIISNLIEFKQKVYKAVGDEYTVLGDYENANIKTLVKHNICGNEYLVSSSKFLNAGRRCPKCKGGVRYSNDEYKSKFLACSNDEYELLSNYKNQKTKIIIKHKICNNILEVNPTSFLLGKRCKYCQHRSYKKTHEEFINEVKDATGDEFEVLGKYINNNTHILMKHISCSNEFLVKPYHFLLSGSRCPVCKESKLERKINDILLKNNVSFIRQYKFDGCKNKRRLPFDFYLNELNICVEADGIQHFIPKWNIKSFNDTKTNDAIKNDYCKNNNIKLIRISYLEYEQIEDVLKKHKII